MALTCTAKHTHSIHVQWEPGNGTRYDVLATRLEQTFMGHGVGTYLITVSDVGHAPKSFFCTKGTGPLRYQWVAEKAGLGSHDASVVTEIVGAILDRTPVVSRELWYREQVPEFKPIYEATKATSPRM